MVGYIAFYDFAVFDLSPLTLCINCNFLWPPCIADADMTFLPCDFSLSFFPRLISAVADWMSTILRHMVCPSANLECRAETCYTRLAGNAGGKKCQKFAIWAVSQTLRRWTEGATYIRQGGHHVGHWSTFLVTFMFRYRLLAGRLRCRNREAVLAPITPVRCSGGELSTCKRTPASRSVGHQWHEKTPRRMHRAR